MVKHNRFFRTLALAAILSLLMIAITATPALAAESLSVSPSKGEVGERVDVSGTGYDPGDVVYIYFSGEEADVGDDIDDLNAYEKVKTTTAQLPTGDYPGRIDAYFLVPSTLEDGDEEEDVHGGDYFVYSTYTTGGDIEAMDEYTVIGIAQIDPDEGPVGTEVEIQGTGFDRNEDITIEFDNVDQDIESGDEDADTRGEFTCTILIPESTAGDHNITAEDESRNEGRATFTVTPEIIIDPEEGTVGDEVTVTGTGFGNRKDITITFDDDEVDISGDEETDTKGSFEATFDVPEVGPGTYEVKAEDTSNNEAEATFEIATSVSISPTTTMDSPGHVGTDITISGIGFIANHAITITYTTEPVVFTTTSGSDGSFSYTFGAPPSAGGVHTITATDGTNSMQTSFFMESAPPQIPPPLLPYLDTKADSETYFDWEDVTKDINGAAEQSLPVTYDLQIATSDQFTEACILVNKTGLTTSEYTLTEAEALESTSEEEPYYWRIRAVDAASNASAWTGAGTFHVGFIFGFPEITGWVLYVLIGVGALVVFFIGFWIGRRGGGGEYY